MGRSSLLLFFAIFAAAPGFAYQAVQDVLRPAGTQEEALRYLLGVAPNLLGGVTLSSTLFIIFCEIFPGRSPRFAAFAGAGAAIGGLWAWEIAQLALSRAVFDVHDLVWTAPGVLLSLAASRLWFGEGWKKARSR